MNTLDDLRSTLGREADRLDDTDRYVRPVAVRQRIRAARRRRASVAAVAVAALVVGGVAGVDALREPDSIQPAASLLGVDVPEEVTVTGFPYELSETATFSERGSLELDAKDDGRAVSLVATGLGGGSATLYADGEPIARARGDDDLEAPVPVWATSLRLRLDGAPDGAQAGLAVYDATGDLASGVTDPAGEAVFRDTIAGNSLLAAAFSEPGESEASVSFTGALSDVRFADYCTSDERGLWINVEIDDQGPISGQCRDGSRDAGTSSSSFEGDQVRDHTVRAYLTRGADGPEVGSDSAVVGVAVYDDSASAQRVLGMRVAETLEYAGRTWVLDDTVAQPAGDRGAVRTTIDTADGDRVLGLIGRGSAVGLSWTGALADGASTAINATDGSASTIGGVLLSGDSYEVTLDSRDGSDFDGVLLVYRPV